MEKVRRKECAYCEEKFKYKIRRGPDPKYCSEKCKREINKELDKNRYNKNCKECGEQFKTSQKNQKYCSRNCYNEDSWTNKREKLICDICGDKFLPNNPEQKYCSQKCGSVAAAETQKNDFEITECEWCGEEYKKTKLNPNQKYCSKNCKWLVWRKKQRAIKREAHVENVKLNYLYKRDNGFCQICGKKVYKKYDYPNDDCATIDHVIPLSKGGEHSNKNCQLAHWKCNKEKGNSILSSQLKLFG